MRSRVDRAEPGWIAWTRDGGWTQAAIPPSIQIALATFGILTLELAVIRWAGCQIRILAYFNNLVLIAAFLGMGLGVALGRRRPGLLHATIPGLAVLAVVFCASGPLGLMHLGFPDPSVALWGAEEEAVLARFAGSLGVVAALFWLIASVFLCAGAAVGALFPRMRPLRAYTWDLAGSLLGVLAFAGITWAGTGPGIWFALGVLPFVLLSRRLLTGITAAAVVALAVVSVDGAVFSPYNRIDLFTEGGRERPDYMLGVNRDFHQFMHDYSEAAIRDPGLSEAERAQRGIDRSVYQLPFVIGRHRERALIVGAGTGNDVMGALRSGFREVTSVDIDGRIIDLGRRYHPEAPYRDPRVIPVVDDARAFFEQYRGEPFDVVCYGLLDSHAMFSALSTLRLENYVYTREGLQAAWSLVAPEGHLTLCFSVFAGDWISDRIYWTLAEATGKLPTVIAHGLNHGSTYVVSRGADPLDFTALPSFARGEPTVDRDRVRITTDDWPFLYVRPGRFPWGYLSLLAVVLATGFLAVRRTFGRSFVERDFDLPMFLMGAAFLLLETRGVTNLSLLFGSTWVVNAAVFAGVLVMALAANLLVDRFPPRRPGFWFWPLLASVAALFFFRPALLTEHSFLVRGVLGGVVNALPVAFAGGVISTLLARSRNPTASLGSNLLGALLGGCLEYLSMWVGLRAVGGLVFVLYACAWLALRRTETREGPGAREVPA